MVSQISAMNATDNRVPPRYREQKAVGVAPLLLFSLGILTAGLILFLFNPAQSGFYPFCVFYKTTGLLCPGCGSLRAMHQLLHGHFVAALHFNAFVILSLPFFAYIAARLALAKLNDRPANIIIPPAWLWCGMALLLAFAILRNLPFAHVIWLAP